MEAWERKNCVGQRRETPTRQVWNPKVSVAVCGDYKYAQETGLQSEHAQKATELPRGRWTETQGFLTG